MGAIVRSFKPAATRAVNKAQDPPGTTLWQRNYDEHIIRSERSLRGIRDYITHNPLLWDLDAENPTRARC